MSIKRVIKMAIPQWLGSICQGTHSGCRKKANNPAGKIELAKIAKYPGTREMFESLAREEKEHRRILEEELNKDYYKEF